MDVKERPLKLYFIPYLAAGHMIPLCDIAQFFASRGHHVTIITTPSNAEILHQSKNFRVHTFDFPSEEVGLPDGVENLSAVTDLEKSYRIYIAATTLLREPIESFVERDPPDCIVADFLYCWVEDLAKKLRIPWLVFNGFSLFSICAMESVKKHRIGDGPSSFQISPTTSPSNQPHPRTCENSWNPFSRQRSRATASSSTTSPS